MSVRVKFRRGAREKVLRSPGVKAELLRRAESIAAASGGLSAGYVAQSGEGKSRSRAAVVTGTAEAIVDNARRNTILKNVGAGRR